MICQFLAYLTIGVSLAGAIAIIVFSFQRWRDERTRWDRINRQIDDYYGGKR